MSNAVTELVVSVAHPLFVLVFVYVDCLHRRRIAPFLALRRALRAGMMVRAQCRGFSVRLVDTAAYRGRPVIVFAARGKATRRVRTASIRDAVWVCDELHSGHPFLANSLVVRRKNGGRIAVPDVADGFPELLAWLRANVPIEQRIVRRSTGQITSNGYPPST